MVWVGVASAAQVADGIRGVVVDQSGAAIPGARIAAKDASGTVIRESTSDASGVFSLGELPPGRYEVEVSKDLFESARTTIELGRSLAVSPLRMTLAVSAVVESLVVGAPKVDERPTGQINTSIDRSVIKDTVGFSIAELIGFSPGVTVQQANGPRDVLISVRGSNSRSTFGLRNIQVFEDGFNVTQPDGLARTDLIDPHAYGRIDVSRGPSSSLYGNYAIEGAINFHTRRPEEIAGIEAGQDLGSFGYRNSYLSVGHKAATYEVFGFGSYVSGDGFTAHTAFKTITANVLATYTPSPRNKFTFKFIDNEMYPDLSIRLSLNQFNLNPYQRGCEALAAAGPCGGRNWSGTPRTSSSRPAQPAPSA